MSAPGELDLEQVREALEHACPGTVVSAVREMSAGYTSRQWLGDTDEGPLLIKVPVRFPDPEHSRHLIAATRLAAQAGLPVVRYRAFDPISPATGGPVLIQEFTAGQRATDTWPGLAESGRLRVIRDLGERIARLHTTTGDWFGDVLGTSRWLTWKGYLDAFAERLLRETPPDIIPAGRARLERVLAAGTESVGHDVVPALTHGDIWLDNLLLRGEAVSTVLDFEHARFLDPLYDFGKPDELVFEEWPSGREAFLDGYTASRPLPADADRRITVYRGFHYLFMFTWFARWQREHVPEYRERLDRWTHEAETALAR